MKRSLFCLALISAVVFLSCSKDKTPLDPGNCDGVAFGFDANIAPVFAEDCAVSGCHSGPGDDGGFSLDGLEDIRAAVNSGRPVVEVIDAGDMPPSGSLDAPEINRIKCWVAAGMPG